MRCTTQARTKGDSDADDARALMNGRCFLCSQGAPLISIQSGAVVIIDKCRFRSNTGSAVRIYGGDVSIQTTDFISNGGSATQGGAILLPLAVSA
jgi:hypothetical protein